MKVETQEQINKGIRKNLKVKKEQGYKTQAEENIEALKDALKERDKMISSCLGDIVELKKELASCRSIVHNFYMKIQELGDAEEGKGIQ